MIGNPRAIAVATYQDVPEAMPGDRLVIEVLEERYGVTVEAIPWDASDVDWGQYEAVLIRSTWNYHRRPDAFLAWADDVEAAGAVLWNPASVVSWNAKKGYLRDLEQAGLPVVPTAWIPQGSRIDLGTVLRDQRWPRAVVKPSVSATAFRTWISSQEEAEDHQGSLDVLLMEADAMVQPFLSQVQDAGEWSFVFFADHTGMFSFSHAVVKRPVAGDFRVQDEFGGSVAPAVPSPSLLHQVEAIAEAVTRIAPGPLLYARIDGVVSKGSQAAKDTFLLMELELIEPDLFLRYGDHAPERFADAVASHFSTIEEQT